AVGAEVGDVVGRNSFITGAELQLMDELHEFIQRGGSAAAFKEMRGLNQDQAPEPDPSSSGLIPSAADFMGMLSSMMGRAQPDKRLSYLEQLEQACQQNWVISTSDVAELLRVPYETVEQYHQTGFINGSFAFRPAGRLVTGELGWQVEKYRGNHLQL
ncbi:MAG: hypothetical protein F6J97_21420, partial [Leptolyngbya sp. SIO4C1]|nr:hypothetical protein [Leptolyngbya sp. SIO4C1]